jgi:excinuclease UvrABC nuclease subunit
VEIPGVGAKTAQKLLKEFGSVANVRRAGVERVSLVIPRKSAERVLAKLEKEAIETNR